MVNSHHLLGAGEHRVIALHGWLGDHRAFAPLWPDLDPDRFAWAFPDCRGYGDSRDVAGEFTLDEIARDVLALADHLGWDQFSLVGHSMGAVAAQRVLATAPDRVRRLVGINPVPATGMPLDERAWELFSSAATDPGSRRAIIDLTTGGRLSSRWLDRMVRTSLESARPEAVAAYLPRWARADFAATITGSRLPVKVFVGAHDPAVTAELMRATWLTHYPDAELGLLAGAGHYPMEETPIGLLSDVEEFLGRPPK
ncbi:Pimeloyl-ACP methyl ester carboxylesterase [Streptoalloteichus tenebrarius]|uniref:Pimeloyl-ACP methyl ester carboxylesterase n=1 Tax=Streptoalloteichus tenebrarius (strain ATCC 17920 / DSM 40477 / JCM 4838 / CBS 697.72 / NBRC 16177 / NCIMB 11028 / NRRL B-12390 / A12253. 1 / ISP 5477) TaxID=1933 RepID=A0ABT1HQ35_STRSD|nr:alpha/beta hydrolase [Streptoalloteichus tenebrarius]MCP2257625.1 Pimeloyl-ACP methyl ester carboxylesterase [Streptoalloteichus tenebrarius]BFE98584.1 alpha/beta hydrolase [Streptoalloteichus tenebrarius]